MKCTTTTIPDVKIFEPEIFSDERGFFMETFTQKFFEESIGEKIIFCQENESFSKKNVLRGLHYQISPFAQSKLVRVLSGEILDIAVDLRKNSQTYMHYVSVILSDENKKQLFIPQGFAHGFLVLSENAKVHYKDIDDPKLAATLQRKIDYTFGGNLLDRVDKNKREKIIEALAGRGLMPLADDVCPTFSNKDYIVSFTDKLLILMGLSLLTPLFNFEKETIETIYSIDKFLFPSIIVLMIAFFFYAQYEAKKYKQCSSCQIGNNIGVMVKRGAAALAFAVGAYFLVNPY